ncbi:sorbitol dehydrogenase [Acetobacter musti]|uniref:Sorbitol dehydrogenase n=1 Tax=Acetobacter musti TaxID=864732 RepID=A0ABX0JU27_9PROT|nr:sorbitol dehydrogenase family protein [Acetobacter musti]NHN86852.1 sorbitol dehydrogenase [Acetobacter musti]
MRKDRDCQSLSLWQLSPNAMRLSRLLRISRRDSLLTGMSAALLGGVAHARAQDQHSASLQTTDHSEILSQFMAVSRRLTDRDTLDQRIGAALCNGILHGNADRPARIQALYALLTKENFASASDYARAAETQDKAFKDVIHEIMTGWYRGVADGKVVVYRSALMFDITKDAVYPKTYATGGPFYWTTRPPDVARPAGQPALSPSKFVVEPT